jgi:hypothetical protein
MLRCMYIACVVYAWFLYFDLLKEFLILRPCFFRRTVHIYLSIQNMKFHFASQQILIMAYVVPTFFVFLLNNFVSPLGNYLSITNIAYDPLENETHEINK